MQSKKNILLCRKLSVRFNDIFLIKYEIYSTFFFDLAGVSAWKVSELDWDNWKQIKQREMASRDGVSDEKLSNSAVR